MNGIDAASLSTTREGALDSDGCGDVESRARKLSEQLAALTGIDVVTLPAGLETPLRGLEIDSLVFVDFLGRTELEYGFEWDEDTPPEAFETLLEIARTMLGGSAGGHQARSGGS